MNNPRNAKPAIVRGAIGIVAAFIISLAFCFFLTERMDGGPFVSMLTLGLGLAGITLVWERVEQFTLFGSEIKLRALTKDAEHLLSSLGTSRIALYRIALRLVKRESGGFDSVFDSRDDRSVDVIELLKEIEKADLIGELASEITATLDAIISKAHGKLLEATFFEQLGSATSPEEMVELYDKQPVKSSFASAPQDPSIDRHVESAIEQLRLMLEYRRKAADALQDSESRSSLH
ncbi:hypothetical protein DFO67_12164 [Modicisalibacter xianhensis]|uniref:Uncharacterized protein n=1 Tax=Modicisalibacter xianhensis TaxID=442341 RepID=A0A4R8FLR2_9GAMM|nr:hypothetical protein [Halomonas xianhensis]TDX24675.1 hypothetical protein DFO67_12164 [Halomonas xianhensis]